ncbi:MAG: DUF4250 domain-containing protein [Paludibacteraceae bacterium]|nr:DUF4250 domain-containing protein [Paludibacteraceae bacterium]MBR6043889.1 DUF4250 domain-containing protein [Paludibacteraceae bacterium]MCR5568351.1 DUF4250 domain-containing protein [Paludibacteraceae bacterium]
MNELPEDVMMLFSFVNMKLRDEYSSLDDFCNSLSVDKIFIEEKLKSAGFEYNEQQNKFW